MFFVVNSNFLDNLGAGTEMYIIGVISIFTHDVIGTVGNSDTGELSVAPYTYVFRGSRRLLLYFTKREIRS